MALCPRCQMCANDFDVLFCKGPLSSQRAVVACVCVSNRCMLWESLGAVEGVSEWEEGRPD